MMERHKAAIEELCEKYQINPHPMNEEGLDVEDATLMLIDILFSHVRTQADQIGQLQTRVFESQ